MPPSGCQPQSTGPINVYSGHCNVFIHCLRDCMFRSLLGAMHVYSLVFPPCLCVTVNLTYHTQPPVGPIMLSLALFGSLSSSVFSGLWPVLSVIFPLLQAPVAPATKNPVLTLSLHCTSSPPDAFWSFSVWFVLAAAQ